MAHVILHNLSTKEDFHYDVPTREAQALVDLAWTTARKGAPVDWAVKGASHDVSVPRSLRMAGGQVTVTEGNPAGTEWTVRSRYTTTEDDRVTLLYGPEGSGRFAVSYSYAWPHAPQLIEYADRSDAVRAYVASREAARGRGELVTTGADVAETADGGE